MKPRPPLRRNVRRPTARDILPPDVPEATHATPPNPVTTDPEPDPIPEHIRRMLEAAYT